MNQSILIGNGLTKTYQVGGRQLTVIKDFDIAVNQNEVTAIVGPSGTGKSTLLYLLSGLEPPDSGRVLLAGKDIYRLSDTVRSRLRATSFGFIFQSYNLIGSMTALENVELPLRLMNVTHAEVRAKEMLDRVGLSARSKHRPGQLSGGEQQRVSVARALALNPRLIFADEPTGNLDYGTGRDVMGMILRLVREQQAACLLVTHNLEWTELSDRVIDLHPKGE